MLRTQVEEKFSSYFEKWMCQLEEYLPLLLNISSIEQSHHGDNKNDDGGDRTAEIVELVNKLTALHKEYYTTKWASAHEDVLAFFTPVWLTPLENALLWNTDWKPSIVFRLLKSSVIFRTSATGVGGDDNNEELPAEDDDMMTTTMILSEPQMRKIECLKSRIRVEEEKVEREMERQQVAMADRRMVELARLVSRLNMMNRNTSTSTSTTGEQQRDQQPTATIAAAAVKVDGLVEAALRELIAGLERVMKMADCVRLKTLKGVLDILNPIQSVDLLAAFSMLQIRMRKWGKKKQQQPYI